MSAATTRPRSATRRKRRWTEEDLLCLPDDGRKYELVKGSLVEVPTGMRHGEIAVELTIKIHPHAKPWAIVCDSSTGFRTVRGNIRSPDVSVMRKERLPDGKSPIGFANGTPDLAVEVISPSEKTSDIMEKIAEYFESGTQEVWLLFPERKQVHRYTVNLEVQVLNENDILKGEPIVPGFEVRVGDLFAE